MPNEKLKAEEYADLGGINSKASPYATSPMEFLDLQNFDFFTPGSLSERWGSTMYISQTFPAPATFLHEYTKLDGSSYVVIGTSSALWYGATTGQNQGMSFSYFGSTQSDGTYNNYFLLRYPTWKLSVTGLTMVFNLVDNNYLFGDVNSQTIPNLVGNGVVFNYPLTWGASGNVSKGVVSNDWLFAADGNKFWKFNGASTYSANLYPPITPVGVTTGGGGSTFLYGTGGVTTSYSSATLLMTLGLTGTYFFYLGYVNNRGVEGPVWPVASIDTTGVVGATAAAQGGTMVMAGMWMRPLDFMGISSINVYTWWTANPAAIGGLAPWLNTPNYLCNIPVGASLYTFIPLGSTSPLGWQAIVNMSNPLKTTPDYISIGMSLPYVGPGAKNGIQCPIRINAYSPQLLEVYQNRLFMAGFSSTPSIVWFSDVGEPEGIEADWNFEVRTNDGDYITCLRAYSTQLYIFKKRSFHLLTGDNPNNFFLKEVTDQYGCINSNSAVVYDDILLFLDQKGLMMWNGASLSNVSSKVQPFFDRMNYLVALTTAIVEHDKIRNQIVVAIPIDGSTSNNITLVFDYLVGKWTTYKGVTPTIFRTIQGRNNTKNLFFGDAQGRVNWFGPSFFADNGAGFTTYMKTRFLHDMGESTQQVFRRMYLNADSPASSTLVFGVNFYQDYGSSIVLGTTIVLSQFQNRIDFGISAKSVAFEMYNIQTSLPLRIHGFTIESRFLRRV